MRGSEKDSRLPTHDSEVHLVHTWIAFVQSFYKKHTLGFLYWIETQSQKLQKRLVSEEDEELHFSVITHDDVFNLLVPFVDEKYIEKMDITEALSFFEQVFSVSHFNYEVIRLKRNKDLLQYLVGIANDDQRFKDKHFLLVIEVTGNLTIYSIYTQQRIFTFNLLDFHEYGEQEVFDLIRESFDSSELIPTVLEEQRAKVEAQKNKEQEIFEHWKKQLAEEPSSDQQEES